VVWLRELRLVFGASTPATAAVLAVFMAGLGYGSLSLSKRADAAPRPLLFYAHLELFIAATAGLSQVLLPLVRQAYIALGGSVALGWAAGTLVRLLLTTLVLLPATFAMGGTLPAAARAATPAGDENRRVTALLYGVNTIGAVTGAATATFVMLERLGARGTLLLAVALNAAVGVLARELARQAKSGTEPSISEEGVGVEDAHEATSNTLDGAKTIPDPVEPESIPLEQRDTEPHEPAGAITVDHPLMSTLASPGPPTDPSLPRATPRSPKIEIAIIEAPTSKPKKTVAIESPLSRTLSSPKSPAESTSREARAEVTPFVLTAAAVVGFAFLTMELVWYRVLSPLLGGSSYTFGLILAVALAGIGLGGLTYTVVGRNRQATLAAFAVTCALEALLIAVPYALGDRIAFLTLVLRDLGAAGLSGYFLGWTVITSIVVIPASMVAGYQFPLLIALLGRDRQSLGEHVGKAYAFNTLGAILGSLLGGFWLIPGLSALGTWRLCAWLLVVLAALAMWLNDRERGGKKSPFADAIPAALAVTALACLHLSTGPTAVWRHTPIGAGRADDMIEGDTPNAVRAAFRERRRAITWSVDGRESSIGLYTLNDVSFMVNGKSDGAAVNDGGTQVMGGLIGALLQPEPVKRAMVIGLGSGSTAGWLGQLPAIERVDVVELEPKMKLVAEVCAPVNRDVLGNQQVNIIIGDAREVLLTTPERYDLVFSEPSNPYRAGVASLFTREFYQAVKSRLSEGGVFVQWLQAYEIDAESLRMVYATLASVFPSVETWRTKYSDLVLVSRTQDVPLDLARLRERIAISPYREALRNVWRVDSVEGVLAHFVARSALARDIAATEGARGVNTDDKNDLEFSIARALGHPQDFSVDDILRASQERGEWLPRFVDEESVVDVDALYEGLMTAFIAEGTRPHKPPHLSTNRARDNRFAALDAWYDNEHARALKYWQRQRRRPRSLVERMVVADLFAVAGEAKDAEPLIDGLSTVMPVEANAIRAKLHWAQGDVAGAWPPLRDALIGYRTDPWPNNHLMSSALAYIPDIARSEESLRSEILDVLSVEFAMFALHYYRVDLRLEIGLLAGRADACLAALDEIGPHYPWTRDHLEKRVACFELAQDPRASRAREELEELSKAAGSSFSAELHSTSSAASAAEATTP
jgi:spermidine synthase